MNRHKTGLLLSTCLVLAACAGTPPPKEVFYRLLQPSEVQPSGPVLDGNLRVERLRTEGILSERALLFSRTDSPGKVEQYRYHHWTEPPAHLITQDLIHYLQQAGIAAQVIAADIRTDVTYSVDGKLLRLERIIGSGHDQASMEVLLRLHRFDTRKLVMQKRYLETVDVKADGMTDVINALSLARERIYQQFVQDLRGLGEK